MARLYRNRAVQLAESEIREVISALDSARHDDLNGFDYGGVTEAEAEEMAAEEKRINRHFDKLIGRFADALPKQASQETES